MATVTDLPALDHFVIPPMPVKRFTVEEYLRLVRDGFFDSDDRFELLEGWIAPKMTKNPPHAIANDLAYDFLSPLATRAGYHIRNQGSVETADSVPEPDLAIVRGNRRDYLQRHPGPANTAVAVEISDSSLSSDRKLKGRIYARANIPFYWIVNLVARRVEAFADPTGPGAEPSHRSRAEFAPGDLVPLVLDGVEVGRVAVDDLLP